jgi:hypothetical protein
MENEAYLVSNDGFFDGSKVLQWREEDMAPLRSADILDEAAKLVT